MKAIVSYSPTSPDLLIGGYRWIAGAGLGAILGAFAAVVAMRWPQGRSIVHPRSACDGCGSTLRAWELVPILSHLALRGRCRSCRATIDPRHLLIEAIAAAVGAVSFHLLPGWWALAGTGLGLVLLTLAVLDLDHLWLPDRLTLPLLAAGLGTALAGLPPVPADRFIGAGVGGLVLWAIAAVYERVRGRIGLGGGDAKLFAAIGAWIGWRALPTVLLLACLIGIAAVLAMRLAGRSIDRATALPFGTCLAAAAWPVWLLATASGG